MAAGFRDTLLKFRDTLDVNDEATSCSNSFDLSFWIQAQEAVAAETDVHQVNTEVVAHGFTEHDIAAQESRNANEEFDVAQASAAEMDLGSTSLGECGVLAQKSQNVQTQVTHACATEMYKHHADEERQTKHFDEHELIDVTTVMLRNIACRATAEMIAETLDTEGFAGTYNFVFVPRCVRRRNSKNSNLGYGFVDFKTSEDVAECKRRLDGLRLGGRATEKRVEVVLARSQRAIPGLRKAKTGNDDALFVADEPGFQRLLEEMEQSQNVPTAL
mmetsp:Transcript_23839/g.63845  ORF Transcript_23839/g.63845 Transcript_23839/m.63845 type:complete len:274 (-) Transcript_23839:225-1046(-)